MACISFELPRNYGKAAINEFLDEKGLRHIRADLKRYEITIDDGIQNQTGVMARVVNVIVSHDKTTIYIANKNLDHSEMFQSFINQRLVRSKPQVSIRKQLNTGSHQYTLNKHLAVRR